MEAFRMFCLSIGHGRAEGSWRIQMFYMKIFEMKQEDSCFGCSASTYELITFDWGASLHPIGSLIKINVLSLCNNAPLSYTCYWAKSPHNFLLLLGQVLGVVKGFVLNLP